MVGLGNKYPKQLLNYAVHKVLFSDSTVKWAYVKQTNNTFLTFILQVCSIQGN
jgi:hypothetical protein